MALAVHDVSLAYVTIDPKTAPQGLPVWLFETRLMRFELTEEPKERPQLTLEFDNADGLIFNLAILYLGVQMQITFGYASLRSDPHTICIRKVFAQPGKGPVSSPGEWSIVKMTATIERPRLHFRPKDDVGIYRNKSISEIARQVAKTCGYTDNKIFVQDTNLLIGDTLPKEEEISIQENETAHQFLDRLASILGFQFFLQKDELHFHQEDYPALSGYVIEYFYGKDLLEFNIDGDYSASPVRVTGKGLDWKKRRPIAVSHGGDISTGLPETLSYEDTVAAIPERVKSAALKRLYAQSVRKWEVGMSCVGDPRLHRGCGVSLKNFGAYVDGFWTVRGIRHVIDDVGFTTDMKLRRMRAGAIGKGELGFGVGHDGAITSFLLKEGAAAQKGKDNFNIKRGGASLASKGKQRSRLNKGFSKVTFDTKTVKNRNSGKK